MLARSGAKMEEIDWVVPHPGTGQLHTAVRERLSIPQERFVTNYETRANTGSASVPIVLSEMALDGRLKRATSATRPRWDPAGTTGANLPCLINRHHLYEAQLFGVPPWSPGKPGARFGHRPPSRRRRMAHRDLRA